jgi:hypothetical protein
VNKALSNGLIADDLPGIKGLLVDLMEGDYSTEDEALAAIADGVTSHYAEDYPEVATSRTDDIAAAVARAQFLFRTNIFPEMGANWREFPDHIGHLTTNGCFRCHDGNHVADDGTVISRDCNLCHTIVAQERRDGETVESLQSVEYQHPVDIDEEWKTTGCAECHGE